MDNEIISGSSRAVVVKNLFSFIQNNGIRYCIVGDARAYPNHIDGDIDILLEPDALPTLGEKLFHFYCEQNVRLVQILQHEQTAWFFILAWLDGDGKPLFLHPDICGDYYRNGRLFLSYDQILDNRIQAFDEGGNSRGFYVPSPDREFIYYLLKKVDKQDFDERHGEHLSEEWKKDPLGCMEQIRRFWSEKDVELLARAAETDEWGGVSAALSGLQRSLHGGLSFSLMAWWLELLRKVRRVLQPTGLLITLFGPDGSGKSSVIEKVIPALAPAFRRTQYMHLRPRIGRATVKNSRTGGKPPRTATARLVKSRLLRSSIYF